MSTNAGNELAEEVIRAMVRTAKKKAAAEIGDWKLRAEKAERAHRYCAVGKEVAERREEALRFREKVVARHAKFLLRAEKSLASAFNKPLRYWQDRTNSDGWYTAEDRNRLKHMAGK